MALFAPPRLALAAGNGRRYVRDVAFPFRMGAGFAGDINRTHPFSTEPNFNDATHPVAAFGYPCLVNSAGNGVRGIIASDTTLPVGIWGIVTRPWPFQQALTAGTPYGGIGFDTSPGVPASGQAVDVLKSGYVMVKVYGVTTALVKGTPAYVRVVIGGSSPAGVVVGGIESVNDTSGGGALTVLIPNAYFNGAPDSNGIAELIFKD